MKDKELTEIVENIGFEQIILDANLTVEAISMILHELGYIDLEIYIEE